MPRLISIEVIKVSDPCGRMKISLAAALSNAGAVRASRASRDSSQRSAHTSRPTRMLSTELSVVSYRATRWPETSESSTKRISRWGSTTASQTG